MLRFFARRLLFSFLLVVVAASAALLLTRIAPGDLTMQLGPFAPPEEVAAVRSQFALDQPVLEQLAGWAAGVLRLDFGQSFHFGRPVGALVGRAAVNTALLAAAALAFATVVGIGLGIVSGSGGSGILPTLVRGGSIAAVSMPPLITSLFLLFVAARTGWFPVGGMTSVDAGASWSRWIADVSTHLPMPALALALPIAAAFERLQAAALAEQMHQPFVVAAGARGVSRRRLVLRHAWPASLRSITAIYGLAAGSLLSGSFVVEFVSAWPGLGRLMYEALVSRDIYLVAGCAAVGAGLLSLGMLVGDVLLAVSDPRVREAG